MLGWQARRRTALFLMLGALCGVALPLTTATRAMAHVPHDAIADVALSPNYDRDQTVYTISREYLLKSTDGGATWRRLLRGIDNRSPFSAVAVSSTDPRVLYVSSRGDGLYKSTDAGLSWSKIVNGLGARLNIDFVTVSPHSPNVAYAAVTGGGMVATGDGGASWAPVRGLSDATAVAFSATDAEFVVAGDDSGGLLLSEDAGQTWRRTPVTTGDPGAINAIVVSAGFEADRTIFVGTASAGIFETADAGASFATLNEGLSDLRIRSLLVDATGDGDTTLWASTWTGVAMSTDRGESWSDANEGLSKNAQADRFDLAHFRSIVVAPEGGEGDERPIFVAGFNGLFRSDDLGATWHELQTQISTIIVTVAVSPDYEHDSTIAVATYLNGAFLSTDGGSTWGAINDGLEHRATWTAATDYVARLMGIAFSPTYSTDTTLFSGTRGRFLESTTSGDQWTSLIPPGLLVENEFPPDFMLQAYSPAFAEDQTIVMATDGGKVFRSTDAGASFSQLEGIDHVFVDLQFSPAFASDRTLFGGTLDGVFKSVDRGESWSETGTLPHPLTSVAISPGYLTDAAVFAGTTSGLFATSNGGETWTRVPSTLFDADGFIEAVAVSPAFEQDHTLLVSVRGSGLYKSTDAAATFRAVGEELTSDNHVLANYENPTTEPIAFSPNFAADQTVFGFSEAQLFRSTDGGESWEPLQVPVTTHDTSEDAASGELLETPRFEDETETEPETERDADRARRDDDAARLSVVEVLAAIVVALLCGLALFRVRLPGRLARWRVAIRFGVPLVALGAILAVLAR